MLTYLAATAEPSRGWGGPVALLVAVAIFAAIRWGRDMIVNRSPTPPETGVTDDDTQVSAVSEEDDTGPDTEADTSWYGRIVNVGGHRVRAYAVHSGLWAEDDEQDDDGDESDDGDPETIEEAADRMVRSGVAYMEIVRTLMRRYEVSESTAKRAVRLARQQEGAEV